jgi:hypothetical protein
MSLPKTELFLIMSPLTGHYDPNTVVQEAESDINIPFVVPENKSHLIHAPFDAVFVDFETKKEVKEETREKIIKTVLKIKSSKTNITVVIVNEVLKSDLHERDSIVNVCNKKHHIEKGSVIASLPPGTQNVTLYISGDIQNVKLMHEAVQDVVTKEFILNANKDILAYEGNIDSVENVY